MLSLTEVPTLVFFSCLFSPPGGLIMFCCHVSLGSSSLFLAFGDLESVEVYWSGVVVSHHWGFFDVFSWLVGVYGFWEEDHKDKMPFSSHHVKVAKCFQHDLTPVTWRRGSLSVLLAVELLSPPSPHCRLHAAHASYIPPWGGSSYRYYLEFFCMGDLTILPHLFLYASLYLYQYGHMHIYWLVIQYRVNLFCCSNCTSCGPWELFQLAPVFFSFFFFFTVALTFFLAWQGMAGSSCVFPARALETAISPGSPGSFDWRRIL